jgi:signal peptidase II
MIESPAVAKVRDWRPGFWLICIVMLVADQAIKSWARHAFPNEQASITMIPNIIDLTLTYNKGIAFGLFQGTGVLLAPVALAIAGGAAYYSTKHRDESPWVHAAMGLLAAGALGNLYDRVFQGKVTDMFHIRLFNFPIFNLADSCITVAATILILRWGGEIFTHPKGAVPLTPPEEATSNGS